MLWHSYGCGRSVSAMGKQSYESINFYQIGPSIINTVVHCTMLSIFHNSHNLRLFGNNFGINLKLEPIKFVLYGKSYVNNNGSLCIINWIYGIIRLDLRYEISVNKRNDHEWKFLAEETKDSLTSHCLKIAQMF